MGSNNFLPSTTFTMKLSAATLVAILAFSSFSVSAAPTCDECIAAMDALVARLTGEASLVEQISVMVDTICPQAENPGDCITRLTAAWPEIAGLIYPRYLDGNAVCGALGSCALRPAALPVLASVLTVQAPEICRDNVGVC